MLAVAEELRRQKPSAKLVYVIGAGDRLADLPREHLAIDTVVSIRAGKFRRYHGEGWRQLLDISTLLKNLRDAVYVIVGCWQSWRLLGRERPDIIFIKGGFVGVPLGLAAAVRKVPFITHDSDAVPGLANRIIARWARLHAVALPKENYPYPTAKTLTVGVPVGKGFAEVSVRQKAAWRKELGIAEGAPTLLVTGGGNGSVLLNEAVTSISAALFEKVPELHILHITGRKKKAAVQAAYSRDVPSKKSQLIVEEFVPELYKYSGAADVIVARAGANTMADFAAQSRACIIIPNPLLTNGHQLRNAEAMAKGNAVEVVEESVLEADEDALLSAISRLLADPKRRTLLGRRLHEHSRPDAAKHLAELLIHEAED